MAQCYIYICLLIIIVIIRVESQTIWVDVDTGKVLGVSPSGQSQHQQQQQQQQRPQQYPRHKWNNRNYPRNNWQQPNIVIPQQPPVQQELNNANAEWVCRNSRTGDMMIIAGEINNISPEQTIHLPKYPQHPIDTDNPYSNNPWLDRNNQPSQQNNPDQNNEQNPTIEQTSTSTGAPIILTSSPRVPFPTLGDIDWTKYLDETTTKSSSLPSLNSAIDGEGIIQARGGI